MILRLLLLASLMTWLGACHGPGHVSYEGGTCLIDDQPANLAQVEQRQSLVTRHILARQPVFTLITLLVVLLASASHAEKVIFLFSTRGAEVKGLGERVKLALDRYRAHPVRYFSIVAATLSLLLVAGGCYIYLDADKRASERALGLLQFCHLALRTEEERGALDEQRRNLATIQSTAGDIRTLVDKLPPAEQRKAQQIVDEMGNALAKQGKIVGRYAQRSDETTRDLRQHTQAVERSLSSVETEVTGLKGLPQAMHDLGAQMQRLDGAIKNTDGKLDASDGKLSAVDGKLSSIDGKLGAQDGKLTEIEAVLKAQASRPACPACVCESKSPPIGKPIDPAENAGHRGAVPQELHKAPDPPPAPGGQPAVH